MTRRQIPLWFLLIAHLTLGGCSEAPSVKFFSPSDYPQRLSDWGLFQVSATALDLHPDNHIYVLNTPLFTDYAQKLRTVYLPSGRQAEFRADSAFNFPVGTIVSKTFYYNTASQRDTNAAKAISLKHTTDPEPGRLTRVGVHLLETRLLVKQKNGWDALPYVWSGDDAYLQISGDLQALHTSGQRTLNYVVPSRNQCASCHATNHTTGALQPIGLQARHLHRPDPIRGGNQLSNWAAQNRLANLPALSDIVPAATWQDFVDAVDADRDTQLDNATLSHLARSYLDINCGHCHNPDGAADTSALLLHHANQVDASLGVCKPPIAAGRGSGGLLYSIVPGRADQSILAFRMQTTDPAAMMPELGRSLMDTLGHRLISAWINRMSGECR